MFQERPYQTEAQNSIASELNNGTYQQLISMATGTGKTVVFSKLYERLKASLPGQQLILAHRDELIDQAIEKVRAINPTLRVDKEKAEHKADPSLADVIVASVATLGRKQAKRLQNYNWENFDKFIVDEAHHSTAQSYINVFEASGILQPWSKRLLLGVTATPQRSDGKALAAIYQKISYIYSMRQAIEDGWLVDVIGQRVETKTSLDKVKTAGGDFKQDELADAVNNPQRNQLVVKAWLDLAQGRQTIGFTVDIQHAVDLATMFRQYGVKAEAVWGDDPERADKIQRHKACDITVLLNCGVLTEGYDDWRVGCILLARPTKSGVLFAQMVGRGTRLQDGTGNLKENLLAPVKRDCIVIDVVDSSTKHSLITLPTLMGLSTRMNLKGTSVVRAVQSLEAAQREHSHIDFSQLTDITQIEAFIQSVNLFDIKFPPEVEENSELSWMTAADGGYILMLPKKDKNDNPLPGGEIRIKQNLLDKWEINGTISNIKYKGVRDSVEQVFKAADDLIYSKAADHLKILKREEKWHNDPPSVAQMNLLRKFYKGKPLPYDLTKGKASRLISSFLAGKA